MKFLNKLNKYYPLAGVLVIFLSFLRQFIYYYQFNIDITNYVSLSEFIILFLKHSIIIILIIFLVYPLVLLIKNLRTLIKKISKMDKIKKRILLVSIFVISGIINYLTISNLISHSNTEKSGYFIVSYTTSIFFIILTYSVLLIMLRNNISRKVQLISGVLFTVIFTISIALLKSYQTKNTSSDIIFEIKLEKETIITDDKLLRVGQTENYLFLYDIKKESTRIIKTEKILELFIHSKD